MASLIILALFAVAGLAAVAVLLSSGWQVVAQLRAQHRELAGGVAPLVIHVRLADTGAIGAYPGWVPGPHGRLVEASPIAAFRPHAVAVRRDWAAKRGVALAA